MNANRVILFLLIIVVLGIVLSLQTIIQGSIVAKLKNSAGNLSTMNILMMAAVFVLLYLVFAYVFRSKEYRRRS